MEGGNQPPQLPVKVSRPVPSAPTPGARPSMALPPRPPAKMAGEALSPTPPQRTPPSVAQRAKGFTEIGPPPVPALPPRYSMAVSPKIVSELGALSPRMSVALSAEQLRTLPEPPGRPTPEPPSKRTEAVKVMPQLPKPPEGQSNPIELPTPPPKGVPPAVPNKQNSFIDSGAASPRGGSFTRPEATKQSSVENINSDGQSSGDSYVKLRTGTLLNSAPPPALKTTATSRVPKNTNFSSPNGSGVISTDAFMEDSVADHFKTVDNLSGIMKEYEKRLSKMNAASMELSSEATALSVFLKKHAVTIGMDTDNAVIKEIATSMGRLSEVFRYLEIIRDQCLNTGQEGNSKDFTELICQQMKTKKKKLDDIGSQSYSLSKRLTDNMKKKAVNVVKNSEMEREKEDLFRQYVKLGAEYEAEFQVNVDMVCWKALERLCSTAESNGKFYKLANDACESIIPDIEQSKQRIIEQKGELSTRLKQWSDVVHEVDIDIKETDEGRLKQLKWMVSQERIFHKNIQDFTNVYIKSAWTNPTLWSEITKEDMTTMFSTIEPLYNFHTNLLVNLENVIREWPSKRLSDVSQDIFGFGSAYNAYLVRLPSAVRTLTKCKNESKALQSFFKSCSSKCDHDVLTCLTLPAKNIGKYPEFLKKYIFEADVHGEDDSKTSSVLDEISSLECELSKSCGKAMAAHVRENISGLEDDVDWDTREYITEGHLGMQTGGHGKTDNHVFLFSDCVIYTKKSSDSKKTDKFEGKIDLRGISIKDDSSPAFVVVADNSVQFQIITANNETFVFSAPTREVRIHWVSSLSKAKKAADRRRGFGVSIKTLMTSTTEMGNDLPSFIQETIDILTERVNQEGIFRLSGNRKDIDNLKRMVDAGSEISFADKDTHCLTGFMKMWLKELPTSIIPSNVWGKLFEYTDNGNLDGIRFIFERYERYERFTTQAVFKLLQLVAENSGTSKMQSSNLAIVFGPLLYREDLSSNLSSVFPVIINLIDNYNIIWKNVEGQRTIRTAQPKKRWSNSKISPSDDLTISTGTSSTDASLSIGLADVVRQGALTKKGAQRRNWKERWWAQIFGPPPSPPPRFVLKNKFLYYFASRKDTVSKGVITLVNATVNVGNRRDKEFGFSVATPDREFFLCAKSEQEMQDVQLTKPTRCNVLIIHPTVDQQHTNKMAAENTNKPTEELRTFLLFPGVNGTSKDAQYKGYFEINSIQWGLGLGISSGRRYRRNNDEPEQPVKLDEFGYPDREASSPSVSEISLTKKADAESPALIWGTLTKKPTDLVTIDIVKKVDGKWVPTTRYLLNKVLISGFSLSCGEAKRPSESISLNYGGLEIVSFTEDGTPHTSVHYHLHTEVTTLKKGSKLEEVDRHVPTNLWWYQYRVTQSVIQHHIVYNHIFHSAHPITKQMEEDLFGEKQVWSDNHTLTHTCQLSSATHSQWSVTIPPTFTFPLKSNPSTPITIHQNHKGVGELGTRIWDGAVVLARFLEKQGNDWHKGKKVIELGSGTGLTGIVTAACGASITMTDKAALLPLLRYNVQQNSVHYPHVMKNTTVDELLWGDDTPAWSKSDIIIGADLTYDFEDLPLLIRTMSSVLLPGGRVYLAYGEERAAVPSFFEQMKESGFVLKDTWKELDASDIKMPTFTVHISMWER
ncbi:hypothetical protein PROFUN_07264 [Planoprotostelium fungivorum]|uniref:Uncharacterized protein n=1 Tax=Planoprotostelium fungivorum TaxID=1890364 RepID=A0A2P6NM97_9EUKA|nr:hypothetical protein PROFUN_07264 [Planoprotostelium fungivorum]